jgi:DNA-binding LacI/PurR family transcriptional regulator
VATIQDVARAAGVGVGTVSRVLNGSPLVSDATRARVQQVIDDLGYRPSPLARALSTGRSSTIAVVAPFFTRPSVVQRLRGLSDVLGHCDYDLVLFDVESPEQRDRHYELAERADRCAGMIVVSLAVSPERAAALAAAPVPVVFVDRRVAGLSHIHVDDVAGGRLATEHLLALGHSRIAFVGDRYDDHFGFTSSIDRRAGYLEAMAAADMEPPPGYVRAAQHGRDQAIQMTRELMSLDEPPTAVFAASDHQALGVLEAARAARVAVPEQLSVIGYDDLEVAPYLGLTTIRQPLYESGASAAEVLLAEMSGDERGATSLELELTVVERATTAPPG